MLTCRRRLRELTVSEAEMSSSNLSPSRCFQETLADLLTTRWTTARLRSFWVEVDSEPGHEPGKKLRDQGKSARTIKVG